jgi:hypothetical protein
MSSPEYLRRHYGIVPPTGETPRFSTPENLERRTGAIAPSVDIPLNPKPKLEAPSIQIVPVQDPLIAGNKNWSIGISPLKASGAKTLKVSDFLIIPEQLPNVYQMPKSQE